MCYCKIEQPSNKYTIYKEVQEVFNQIERFEEGGSKLGTVDDLSYVRKERFETPLKIIINPLVVCDFCCVDKHKNRLVLRIVNGTNTEFVVKNLSVLNGYKIEKVISNKIAFTGLTDIYVRYGKLVPKSRFNNPFSITILIILMIIIFVLIFIFCRFVSVHICKNNTFIR